MKRLGIVILNLFLIIIGFLTVYYNPISVLAITVGWILISVSIISFAILIYFPPPQEKYIKLKVIEEKPTISKTPLKTRSKKRPRPKKRPKKKKKAKKRTKRRRRR